MVVILFYNAEPFEQTVNTPLTEDPMWNLVKIGQMVSVKMTFKDFSTFSPYKCFRMQIWPCLKKVKGHPRIIIWTNLVDLASPLPYTKIQPQNFLASGEENF